jgi:hypothetical protein
MDIIDWILAAAFTAILSFVVSLLLPPPGWLAGALVALVLLFIAKRKRDSVLEKPSDPDEPAK